ncbi:COG2335: Secreted and surface protein containing fasciclin-like repeats [Pseudoalteromonas luteoviolacea B = ATCC 29581]|nr:COG2335: Secreted and surface protein containing fasciclin-like repeats [Pseudoalteromonas luteoviolacea B = ATCC 29581]
MKTKLSLIALGLSVSLLAGCSDNDDEKVVVTPPSAPIVVQTNTIVDVATENGSFTTLVAALKATGLDSVLADTTKTFTVFAPTDAAFALLGEATINELLAQPDKLADILSYHVLEGSVNAEGALGAAGTTVAAVNGDKLGLSFNGETLQVNTATVVTTDVMTDNGIIHVIDAVLMPPADMEASNLTIAETAQAAGSFNTLLSLLALTGLDAVVADTSQTFTVFAPTDEAFAQVAPSTLKVLSNNPEVLKAILLQHVTTGAVDSITAFSLAGKSAETASGALIPINIDTQSDMLKFGNASIVAKDIKTSNGVIHVLDSVVVGDVQIPDALGSLTEVARDNGNFTTLIAALEATGLDTVVSDLSTDFTVFAPTDAAFAKLGEETINALLQDTETLKNILLYHVVAGQKVASSTAVDVATSTMNTVTMANNQNATLTLKDGKLMIDSANIVAADVMADNGIIHVIDSVILPPRNN